MWTESKKPWEHRSMLLGILFKNRKNVSKETLGRRKERPEEGRKKKGRNEGKKRKRKKNQKMK